LWKVYNKQAGTWELPSEVEVRNSCNWETWNRTLGEIVAQVRTLPDDQFKKEQ